MADSEETLTVRDVVYIAARKLYQESLTTDPHLEDWNLADIKREKATEQGNDEAFAFWDEVFVFLYTLDMAAPAMIKITDNPAIDDDQIIKAQDFIVQ